MRSNRRNKLSTRGGFSAATLSGLALPALFLASDEASFMTGSIVSADGGMTAQ